MPVTWADPAEGLALEALLDFQPFVSNRSARHIVGLSKRSIACDTTTGSAPSQRTTLPCSKAFFLNTEHESFKILSYT